MSLLSDCLLYSVDVLDAAELDELDGETNVLLDVVPVAEIVSILCNIFDIICSILFCDYNKENHLKKNIFGFHSLMIKL